MSKVIQITETDLIRLIKNIISEQIDHKPMFGQPESYGYKQGDASTFGPALKRQEQAMADLRKITQSMVDNPHEWLGAVGIASVFLQFLPVIGPFFKVTGLISDLMDSALYYYEGDKYMGTMMLGLSFIPGSSLVKIGRFGKFYPKLVKVFEKIGKGGGKNLTKQELSIFKLGVDEFTTHATIIGQLLTKEILKSAKVSIYNLIKTTIKRDGFKKGLKIIFTTLLKKMGSIGLIILNFFGKITLQIGGTYYSMDQIYLALFGNDSDRKNSQIQKIVKLIKNYTDSDYNALAEELIKHKLTDTAMSDEEYAEYKKNKK